MESVLLPQLPRIKSSLPFLITLSPSTSPSVDDLSGFRKALPC
ncbi:hypothetical protein VPHD239_0109 [Vibrio phage D239]